MAPNLLHIYFTKKRHYYIPEYNNDTPIPYYADIAKYLAMTLDAKLQWIAQIKKKGRTEPKTWKNVYGQKLFPFSVQQSTYNQVIKPVRT